MAEQLGGKVILVTGATGGVGIGVVNVLAKAGACLAMVDRKADDLAELINNDVLKGDVECYKGFPADLSDPESFERLLNHVVDAFGEIDGLVQVHHSLSYHQPVARVQG